MHAYTHTHNIFLHTYLDPPPDFVSVNIGVFLCINCAGKHRNMNSGSSLVRSIHLDSFDEKKYEVSD